MSVSSALAREPSLASVPREIDPDTWRSIPHLLADCVQRFEKRPCFTSLGTTIEFGELDALTRHFAAFLQHDLGLRAGDRIAIQIPNLLQQPVAMLGALRAGLIVVNINPLYTPREMAAQYADSGAKAVVILTSFAKNLQSVQESLRIPHVILTEVGDLLPGLKRLLTNVAVKHVKKSVPGYQLPGALWFRDALERGARHSEFEDVSRAAEDIAFLQYTGGTTGVSKAAMLTHRNVLANIEQTVAFCGTRITPGEETIVTALPLYHIFALTVNCLCMLRRGAHNVLVADPRDVAGLVRVLASSRFTALTGVNTLFNALLNSPDFQKLDFRRLKLCVAGAMPLQRSVVDRWRALTGVTVVEGYGLTEASPVVCCNPMDGTDRPGTIGVPYPSTEIRIVDEAGSDVAPGETGELLVRGPQVMKGYWNRPDETDKVLKNGWLFTGDVAQMVDGGFFKILDRIKDLVLVSGFNVYPNEVEEVMSGHPGVAEVAVVGVPDEKSGQAVKLVVVPRAQSLSKEELIVFARERLAPYKVPRHVEFVAELPKSNVGKVLRRSLRA